MILEESKNHDPRHLLVSVVKILEDINIPYIVSGGMAVFVWGRPRFTADVDIVVELKKTQIDKLNLALRKLGENVYIDKEMMEDALLRQGEFNFIDNNTGTKVDFWILKNTKFDQARLKRKIKKIILGRSVYFTSPEDLILMKLIWHKDSGSFLQLDDIKSIFKASGKKLDMQYLKKWAVQLDVSDILENLLKDKKERP